jgi:hypothetical protein
MYQAKVGELILFAEVPIGEPLRLAKDRMLIRETSTSAIWLKNYFIHVCCGQ